MADAIFVSQVYPYLHGNLQYSGLINRSADWPPMLFVAQSEQIPKCNWWAKPLAHLTLLKRIPLDFKVQLLRAYLMSALSKTIPSPIRISRFPRIPTAVEVTARQA